MLQDFKVSDGEVLLHRHDLRIWWCSAGGFGVGGTNAVFEIKQAADYVTRRRGGDGAVRGEWSS